MAAKAVFTVEQVLDELDNDEVMSDVDSEDDFEGYVDEDEYLENDELEDEEFSRLVEELVVSEDRLDELEEESSEMSEEISDDEMMDVGPCPSIPEYTHKPGLIESQADKSPAGYFFRFVTGEMLVNIVQQTKLYSQQYREAPKEPITKKSRIRRWLKEEPTVPELLQFIALVLVMGIIKYPTIESHWSTSWPYVNDACRKVSCCKN